MVPRRSVCNICICLHLHHRCRVSYSLTPTPTLSVSPSIYTYIYTYIYIYMRPEVHTPEPDYNPRRERHPEGGSQLGPPHQKQATQEAHNVK